MAIASVTALSTSSTTAALDSEEFRVVIEDFLEILKNAASTVMKPIPEYVHYQSRFDWIGLLSELGIHKDLYWTVVRMNGGKSLTDVPEKISMLLVPQLDMLTNIAGIMNTRKRL